jgi:hypothetical protein
MVVNPVCIVMFNFNNNFEVALKLGRTDAPGYECAQVMTLGFCPLMDAGKETILTQYQLVVACIHEYLASAWHQLGYRLAKFANGRIVKPHIESVLK